MRMRRNRPFYGKSTGNPEAAVLANEAVAQMLAGATPEEVLQAISSRYGLIGQEQQEFNLALTNLIMAVQTTYPEVQAALQSGTTYSQEKAAEMIAQANQRVLFLQKLIIDLTNDLISAKVLQAMVGREELNQMEYEYILNMAAIRKGEVSVSTQPVSAQPVSQPRREPKIVRPEGTGQTLKLERTLEQKLQDLLPMLQLKSRDQQIIDDLPEILGFKFCPKLFKDSGVLPPLADDFVTMDYELAYMQNIKQILLGFSELFFGDTKDWSRGKALFKNEVKYSGEAREVARFYSLLPGGLLSDGESINPTFPRNLWLNIVGLRITTDPERSILNIDNKTFMQSVIELQLLKVNEGIAVIQKNISDAIAAEQQAQLPVQEEGIADEVVESEEPFVPTVFEDMDTWDINVDTGYQPAPQLPEPVPSDVPAPISEPFYKKTSNQVMLVLGLLVVGYFMTRQKKSTPSV